MAASSVATRRAAAPSVMPEALPAVTVPPARNTGGSLASDSAVMPSRGCSSCSTRVSPLRPSTSSGAISRSKRPLLRAASQRCWLESAQASASARVRPLSAASSSAVSPITSPESGSLKPSRYMPSTIFGVPQAVTPAGARQQVGRVRHALGAAGQDDRGLAARMVRAAESTACSPEPHAWLMVYAGRSCGIAARQAIWRAVFGPPPAWRAWPKIVWSTRSGADPGPLQAGEGRGRAEIGGRERGERAAELADRRAHRRRQYQGLPSSSRHRPFSSPCNGPGRRGRARGRIPTAWCRRTAPRSRTSCTD